MLIDVEKMRLLRTDTTEMKFKLLKTNIERFFRDYIYYYNIYDRDELIVDSGYLPYHYLDGKVLDKVIDLFEKELGYNIIIVKTTNLSKPGYQKGDLINIRIFDRKTANPKDVDDYFNLKMFTPLYSSFHNYYNINGEESMKKTETPSYISCLNVNNSLLLDDDNDEKIENVNENSINVEKDILKNVAYQDERKDIKVEL